MSGLGVESDDPPSTSRSFTRAANTHRQGRSLTNCHPSFDFKKLGEFSSESPVDWRIFALLGMDPNQPCAPYSDFDQARTANTFQGRLVTLSIDQLRPHPSYVKHRLAVSVSQLASVSALGELTFQQPIMVTQSGIVIEGYDRWELARRLGRETIACLEYDLSDEDALRWLIHLHCPSKGMNGFCRSLLALDLEPSLQEKSRLNQQVGGQLKGSANLTEAQKMDVRSKIAATAHVSTGSLTKAKQVVTHAAPVIHEAAKSGEIRVHRAWQWSRIPHWQQLKKLEDFRSCKGVGLVSRKLIQKHVERMAPTQLISPTLSDILKPLGPNRSVVLQTILISEINAPGRIAYFTRDAISALRCEE